MAANPIRNADAEASPLVRYAWILLIWSILFGRAVVSLARPDDASSDSMFRQMGEISPGAGQSALSTYATYGVHALGLSVAVGAIVLSTRYSRSLGAGVALWLAAMAFAAGPVLSSFYGAVPGVTPDLIRLPLFFTAVFLLQPVNLHWFVQQCKYAIGAYTFATLGAVVIVPSQVLVTTYDASLIPGFSIRLFAIGGGHPNSFAPLLGAYLMLRWIVPDRTPFQKLTLVAVVGSLVLTQSKTIFLALLVVYIIRFFYIRGFHRFVVAYALSFGALATMLILSFARPGWNSGFIDSLIADDDYTTLTGRTKLWEHSLELWREYPILGYGPEGWQMEMTVNWARIYNWVPTTAHNQLLQTLGESGLVGLFGLLLFIGVVLYKCAQYSRITRGASLALIVFILVQGITEQSITRFMDERFFLTFVTFSALVLLESRSRVTVEEDEPSKTAAGTPSEPQQHRNLSPAFGSNRT